jgi:hypothetical protein
MKIFLFLIALSIASTGAEDSSSTDVKDKFPALARARSLNPPVPMATYGGDIEDLQFWTTNEQLIQDALKEYGKHHSKLYDFNTSFQENYMEPILKEAVRNKDLRLLSSLIHETNAPGVYAIQILNSDFAKDFLEELDHYESSGIPLRRPNSMNRYGVILSSVHGRLRPFDQWHCRRCFESVDKASIWRLCIAHRFERELFFHRPVQARNGQEPNRTHGPFYNHGKYLP